MGMGYFTISLFGGLLGTGSYLDLDCFTAIIEAADLADMMLEFGTLTLRANVSSSRF